MSKSPNKKGILVVDDAQFIRNRIKKAIEKIEFCEVVGEASNGDDAIALYKELKPDLVTMDLVMPNTDGIKAIEEILKYDKQAKIIVISAVGQDLTILEATEKGAKDYIKKPFKEEDVYKTIEKFLKS